MQTRTRIAEGLSALLILMLGAGNPHHGIGIYLVLGIEIIAAAYVAATFPGRRSAMVALALAGGVLLTMFFGVFGTGGGGGLHAPIMGLGALSVPVLLLSQIVAAIAASRFLRRGDSEGVMARRR